MKITKSQLQKIIKEEIKAVVVAEAADEYKNWSWKDMDELTTDLEDIRMRIMVIDRVGAGDLGSIIMTLEDKYTLSERGEYSDPRDEEDEEAYDQAAAMGVDIEDDDQGAESNVGWDLKDY